jgi:hypothetical protein
MAGRNSISHCVCAIFLTLFSISSLSAQVDAHVISLKFGSINTVTNYDSLTLNYYDQANPPHHLYDNFRIGNSPTLLGGELTLFGITTKKNFYFEGLGLGLYLHKKASIFQFNTGAGYSLKVTEKFRIIPSVEIGYGLHSTRIGIYYPFNTPLIINSKTIVDDFEVDVIHNTLYAVPKLALFYNITENIGIRLVAGYRSDMFSKEKINISEYCQNCGAVRTARTSIHSGIMSNGEYVNGKLVRFSGLNVGIQFVYTISDF